MTMASDFSPFSVFSRISLSCSLVSVLVSFFFVLPVVS
jgi:hypothetical protein